MELTTDYAPLADYVQNLLSRILVQGEQPNVTSQLRWVTRAPFQRVAPPPGADLPEIAYGVRGSGERVGIHYVPGFPGLAATYEGTGPVRMHGRLISRWPADRLRSALGRYAPGYFPTRLMYHAVYVPAAWYLGCVYRRFWAHAGAVVRGDDALLVGGLAGIGKSTLCLRLMREAGFRLLSDDLVLYDRERIYTCYEPVRVVAGSAAAHAGIVVDQKRAMGDKSAGELNDMVIGSARPKVLLLPRFGNETRLRDLDSETAARRFYTTSRLAAQVSEFDYYATVLAAYHRDDDWFALQLHSLGELLRDVQCFELEMRRADGPQSTFELVREVVDGAF